MPFISWLTKSSPSLLGFQQEWQKSEGAGMYQSYRISSSFNIIIFNILTAIQDYETAQEHNENDQQIREGLEKAQRLLKQSQKRDYYKILGVKR